MTPPAMIPSRGLILGIETSCDETAASVVECSARGAFVRSNVIASQHDLHAEYRGVVPEIASRAHVERLLPVIRAGLKDAGASYADLAAIAVGHRPGLIGSLLVGVAGAKALAWSLGVPLAGVDHIQAHLYAACLNTIVNAASARAADSTQLPATPAPAGAAHSWPPGPAFPAIGLVVSGGHTSLYRCDSPTRVRRLGSTIDDAIGEAYDKVAAILGLPFPGGPSVDRLAASGNPRALDFPVSRLAPDSLDFSFSGLKTAVLYAVKGVPAAPERAGTSSRTGASAPAPGRLAPEQQAAGASPADVAASFQRAAVRAVIIKIERALLAHSDCRTILVGGGVSANSLLRAELALLGASRRVDVRLPAMSFCLDNAAMIAGLAWHVLVERGWQSDPLSLAANPAGST